VLAETPTEQGGGSRLLRQLRGKPENFTFDMSFGSFLTEIEAIFRQASRKSSGIFNRIACETGLPDVQVQGELEV
jgi:hypothetical protein